MVEGIVFSAVIAMVAYLANKTDIGKQFSLFTYRVLQTRLSQTNPSDLPITVIDISELRPDQQATPRRELTTLVQALSNYRPKVIGIDVDFSPETSDGRTVRFVTPTDPGFFVFCQKITNTQVYLGISRTQALPPDQWLGLSEFQGLAAALWVPQNDKQLARSMAPSSSGEEYKARARTMSTALADAYSRGTKPSLIARLYGFLIRLKILTRFYEKSLVPGAALEVSYIDYGLLEVLGNRAIEIPRGLFDKPEDLDELIETKQEAIRGKMLLLGDVKGATDLFERPQGGDPVPGVLIHASAAYTAAKAPLYGFPEQVLPLVDFVLALIILMTLTALITKFPHRFQGRRLHTLLTVVFVLVVICFGMMVNRTHILWDDFVFVALVIAVHPFFHRSCGRLKNNLLIWLKPLKAEIEGNNR